MKYLLERRKSYLTIKKLLAKFDISTSTNDEFRDYENSSDINDSDDGKSPKRKLTLLPSPISSRRGSIASRKFETDMTNFNFDYYVELIDLLALCCEDRNSLLKSVKWNNFCPVMIKYYSTFSLDVSNHSIRR